MNGDRHLMLALQMAVSQSPLAVELDIGRDVIPLLLEAATCFIVLESIANVAKHAHATNVKVVTEIEDDGVGGATGLRKLKERARAAGGTIEIDSPPGVGTLIRAEVPFATRR